MKTLSKLVHVIYFILIIRLLFILGKMIHSMVAHLDAVTSLAIDPNGLYLLSGSKYIVLLC